MAYTFDDANASGRKDTQYFDIMGSRGLYREGWFASAFGPLDAMDCGISGFHQLGSHTG